MTSELTAVVPGDRDVVVAGEERVGGGETAAGAAGVAATVVVVDTPAPATSVLAGTAPAAKRLPRSVVDVVGGNVPALSCGRMAPARGPVRDPSCAVAAKIRRATTPHTATTSRAFVRAVLLVPYHHDRSRSWTRGRPNAAFLAMD